MLKQQHSFTRLYYHLVFTTKARMEVFKTLQDEALILGSLKRKADHLDAYIEEFGSWYDHTHLLVRASASTALSKIYGQLKGFSARAWNLKNPGRPLGWSDGVFAASVDPEDKERLRKYIRNQRLHHEANTQIAKWEPAQA